VFQPIMRWAFNPALRAVGHMVTALFGAQA